MRALPFKGLYYFYVTAQQQSIKLASDSLLVTQAAVSQQIRMLEEQLNVTLFYRQHRVLVLTDEGERLIPYLKVAFESMYQGVDNLADDADPNTITLSVLSSFASRWFIPRLVRFNNLHPDITVNLSMSDKLEDFSSRSLDAVVRFGLGEYDRLDSTFLMKDYLYPVCHPSYCDVNNISSVEDLKHLRLLDDYDTGSELGNCSYWEYWLNEQNYNPSEFTNRQNYQGSHFVIDAALSAQGIAMVRHCLAAELVQKGHLVKVFDGVIDLHFQYYLCAPHHHFRRPKVKKFIAWLQRECNDFTKNYQR